MRIPPYLKDSGCIGFVAPSFGCATEPYRSAFDNALKKFASLGYRTLPGPNCYLAEGIGISNKPDKCAAELQDAYLSDRSDVLISVGGGELMCEILPYLDLDALRAAAPKWYMGFSDNTNFTFLSAALLDTAAIYGPCASTFGMEPWHPSLEDAMALLTGRSKVSHGYDRWQLESVRDENDPFAPYNVEKRVRIRRFIGREKTVAPLRFEGRLLGGCMDCLYNLIGTPFDGAAAFARRYAGDGVIWFLEACDLDVLSMRRALWAMRQAGWFEGAKGFLIGRPLHWGEKILGLDQYEAVLGVLGDLDVPFLMDVDIGHLPPMMPLVVGARAEVRSRGSRVTVKYLDI